MKARIGILGSTGYTGVVLTKLLIGHPEVEITYLSSEQNADKYFYELYPTFYGLFDQKCKPLNVKKMAKNCDLVFFATPHGFSKGFLPKILNENNNLKIIDLSADLRLEKNFLLKRRKLEIVYGLPELNRKKIENAQIVANPGCYPTSAILGLAPALKSKFIDPNTIVIDSKSGISGAGKQPKPDLHFPEANESFSAYNLAGKHRHIPEIENELSKVANKKISVVFSPHLLPINRGILSTIYAKVNKKDLNENNLYKIYKDFYKDEFFVRVLPNGIYANTKHVRYTNFCHLTVNFDKKNRTLVIVSTIDNMVKGASGQAIQNMNIMLSLKESLGLDTAGQIP